MKAVTKLGTRIFLTLTALLVIGVITSCLSANKAGAAMSKAEKQAMLDAMMMLSLANEDVIRGSAEAVDARELAANPAAHQGKWLEVESEVVWLQGDDGESITAAALGTAEHGVFWAVGPIAVMDQADVPAKVDTGSTVRIFGRCLVVSTAGMGLQGTGSQALAAMDGGSSETVALFLAKWVELQ